MPSFVATFAPFHFKHVDHGRRVFPSATQRQDLAANLPLGPLLQQPFVVRPGFSPVPAKTVSQIVAGKYVDLGDLLSLNIAQTEPESQAFLDGRLVFLPSAKKQRWHIEDIVTWSEAFTIFTLILTSYFPHHWKDLTSYKLLILRTYHQFSGRVWLAYNPAFASTLRGRSLWTSRPWMFSFTIFMRLGPLCVLGLVVPWASYPNHLELTPLRSFLVVKQGPLFGTICFVSVCPSLQHPCGFPPCVRMLPSFWQNVCIRSQTQICFSSLRALVHLENQVLMDAPFCFPDCLSALFLSALIAFSFFSMFPVL